MCTWKNPASSNFKFHTTQTFDNSVLGHFKFWTKLFHEHKMQMCRYLKITSLCTFKARLIQFSLLFLSGSSYFGPFGSDLWLKMSAIVLMFLINTAQFFVLVNGQQETTNSNEKNATIVVNECFTDSRVSMLRCVSVNIDLIQEALDQWNLTSITRLQVYHGKLKNVDKLIHSLLLISNLFWAHSD